MTSHGGHGSRGSKHPGRGYGAGADAGQRYLAIAAALIVAFMAAEITVALTAGSLALLADAGHMLTDAGALAAAIVAMRLARRPACVPWTYGLKRAEILSAAGNGVTLVVIAALIACTAIQRLISPPPVHGLAMLIVAVAGVAVNLAATWVLARANRQSLNVRGAFAHILTDPYAFAGTAAAGLVISFARYTRADPVASLLIVALMARAAWGLLRESGRILLQAAPAGIDLDEVRSHLLTTPAVEAAHDLHAWTVTSGLPVLSAHVVAEQDLLAGSCGGLLDQLQHCLGDHFDVEHSTIQLEPAGHGGHERDIHP